MTFITEKIRGAVTTAAAADRIDLKWTWIATAALCAFFIGVREYEQMFGWKAGMEPYSGEFQTYWMPVLYIFTTLELIAFLGLVFYLFRTRDLDVAKVEPREELRRIFYLLGWILLYGIALYWGASFFSEQEAAWNQALVRNSAFTPVNIIQYYVADPIYIITGIGGLLYARTRLPTFACKGWSIAYAPVHRAAHASAMRGSQRMGEHCLDHGRTGRCAAPLGPCFLAGFPSRCSACRF